MCAECVVTAITIVSASIALSPIALRIIKGKKAKHNSYAVQSKSITKEDK